MRLKYATAILIALGCLLLAFQAAGVWRLNRTPGEFGVAPIAGFFILLPSASALAALVVGFRTQQRHLGLVGFLLTATLSSAIPSIIACLIALYRGTKKPKLYVCYTAAAAGGITLTPFLHWKFAEGEKGNTLYAGAYGYILIFSAVVGGILMLVSLTFGIAHLLRRPSD